MIRAVLIIAAALALVAFVAAASRPLGWLAAAAMVAALLQSPVSWVSRYVPRGLAVPVVLLVALALVGGLAFGVVGDLEDQLTRLERAAPRRHERSRSPIASASSPLRSTWSGG